MRGVIVLLALLFSSSSLALYQCPEHGRIVLSSAPCDTGFAPAVGYHSSPVANSISLRISPAGSYLLNGSVQGVSVVHTVDTGANITAVSSRVISSAGLSGCAGVLTSNTANGVVNVCQVIVPVLTFGPFQLRDISVTVMPNMAQDVLLGMDVLRHFKMHQQAGVLELSR